MAGLTEDMIAVLVLTACVSHTEFLKSFPILKRRDYSFHEKRHINNVRFALYKGYGELETFMSQYLIFNVEA